MRLLIDIGNSRLKWCSYGYDGKLGESYAIQHKNGLTLQQLDECWTHIEHPDAVYMVSVADSSIATTVQKWVGERWSLSVIALTTKAFCAGVRNGYLTPEQLGVDRWAAIIGAYQITNKAVCVIDSGTALTCDAVDNSGQHLGGVIIPGRNLQRQVLLQGASGISNTDDKGTYDKWGRDTTGCITAGLMLSQLGLIEHFISKLKDFLATPVSVVLTGGDAEVLIQNLAVNNRFEPNLVFQGMIYMMMEHGG